MIRPTPAGVGLFALSIPASLLAVTLWPDHWYGAFYVPAVAAVMLLVDWTLLMPVNRLRVTPSAPARLFIGQSGCVRLEVAVTGWTQRTAVEAVLETEGETERPSPVGGTVLDGDLCLELPVRPLRRGMVTVPAVQMRWRGPLGLVERRCRLPCRLRTEVVPDIHGIHDEALRFFSEDCLFGQKSQRAYGEGTEYDKLSEYSSGMDSRFIDWKRSARHRKLLVKEFRQERNHQIVFGLDTGHLMLEPLNGVPRLDHAIRAGLILGWVSLHGGDVVGASGFDARFRGFLQPGRGMQYFTHLQRFAATMDYHTEETNFTLGLTELNSRLKRRGLVVLFSEFVDTISAELLLESLQLLSRRHAVIFVTMQDPFLLGARSGEPEDFHCAARAVIADDFLRDRAIVLERIARLGVHCLDVPAAEMATALLRRYLMIKQKGLL